MSVLARFASLVHEAFAKPEKITVRHLRQYAQKTGIPQDDKILWELAELAWVIWYRNLAKGKKPDLAYKAIVDFYQNVQPTFTARDSTRQIFQQYSTSAPIAWLAGWFTDPDNGEDIEVMEPSAGNGLLTIYYPPSDVTVNEIDGNRLKSLNYQGFANVLTHDASSPFSPFFDRRFEAILMNPPFGSLGEVNKDYGFGFKKLDHVMVAHALKTMANHGRAAIIIGGHTEYDEKNGLVKSGRPFFDWLFRHYQVIDMINIDSAKLYAKQGTTFPLRMILIAGRKLEPFGVGPNKKTNPEYAQEVSTFEALFNRVGEAKKKALVPAITLSDILKKEIEKIKYEIL
jgi:predicted RNA methylase